MRDGIRRRGVIPRFNRGVHIKPMLYRLLSPKYIILLCSAFLVLYFAAFPLMILIYESLLPGRYENYQKILSNKSYIIALIKQVKL